MIEVNTQDNSNVGSKVNVSHIIAKEFENTGRKSEKKSLNNLTGKSTSIPEMSVDKKGAIVETKSEIIFYKPVFDKEKRYVQDVQIINVKLIQLIYSWGFRRYDIGKDYVFIKVIDNVLREVTNQDILDNLIAYIDTLPEKISYDENTEIKREQIKEKIFKSPQTYNNNQKLALLKNNEKIILNTDTKNECFIYFRNGFVSCTKATWTLKPYSKLTGYIWENQIIQRDFRKEDIEEMEIKSHSVFAQFLFNIAGNKISPDLHEKRFTSLCSIAGYLLSSFMDTKLKAIILTDSSISETPSGRTGKTLFGESFKHLKRLTQIPGKDFDSRERYKYQLVDLDTQIIFLNDVRKNFDFECLYNDITEGIKVEKKNELAFVLKTKICISTNKTIKIEGDSSEDRCVEFEFSDYYYAGFGPDNEFGHRFFSEWNEDQWNSFDNFMMYSLSLYLDCGIIKPENINLNRRKLLDETDNDFVYFMDKKTGLIKEDPDGKISVGITIIQSGEEVNKKLLFEEFLSENQHLKDHKFKSQQTTFTKWVQIYVKYDKRFSDFKERRSNKNRFCAFYF